MPMATVKQSFPVLEMTCAACAVSVESMLKNTPGVKDVSVNFANQTALVEYDAVQTPPTNLQQAVRAIGYDLVVNVEDPQAVKEEAQRRHYQQLKTRTTWAAVLSLPVVVIGMFFMDWQPGTYLSMLLSAPVVFYFGRSFFINAFKHARSGKANMYTLCARSSGLSFLLS